MSDKLTKTESEIIAEDFSLTLVEEMQVAEPVASSVLAALSDDYVFDTDYVFDIEGNDDYVFDIEGNIIGISLKVEALNPIMTWAVWTTGKNTL
jgi:hypothetical protein